MKALFSYVSGILIGFFNLLKGLSVTFRAMLGPVNTQQYPEQKPAIPARSRTWIKLIYDIEANRYNCTACMMCAKACPNDCIKLEGAKGEDGKRWMTTYQLDFSTCIFCGLCVEACNFDALTFRPDEFESCVYDRKTLIQDKAAMKWERPLHLKPVKEAKPAAPVSPKADTVSPKAEPPTSPEPGGAA